MYRTMFATVTMHGGPPYYSSVQAQEWHYSLSKRLLKKWDMNGWTHSSFWWLWFTCNSLTSAHTHLSVISSLLRLYNVRTKDREVVHDSFINALHCLIQSPMGTGSSKRLALAWRTHLNGLTTSVQALAPRSVDSVCTTLSVWEQD